MVGLPCQFEIYVKIMFENNRMVEDGYLKRIIGAIIPSKGKRKGRLWKTESYVAKC